MDTKARVALFVGGLVVVGLVAWVLMPAPKSPEVSSTDVAAGDAATPTTQPIALTDPFAAPPATQPTGPSIVAFGGPAPAAPATATVAALVPAAAAPADPNDAWARALDGGNATATMTGTNIPAASAGFPRTHKIQAGETFSSISEQAYGNAKYATRIAAANPTVDPRRLKVGQEVTLPDLNASAAVASPTLAAVAAPTSSGAQTYKVQSGDNLRRISQKVYGTPDRWEKIYAANKTAIGADPSKLKAGQTLQIP